jgi:predicted esterase
MNEHRITISRTARYHTLGEAGQAGQVWFAVHGYGQLASAFLGYLAPLDSGSRLLVAPEALSRFYLQEGRGPIGASWMTREDRDHEITDYVGYLDAVFREVRAAVSPAARFYLLGFSQGVATASRWMDRGTAAFDGACFWAGTVAPDVDPARDQSPFRGKRVALVAGKNDSYLTADWRQKEEERFRAAGADAREFGFHGGHRLDRVLLKEVAAWCEAA